MYLQASKYARKPVSTTKLHKEKKTIGRSLRQYCILGRNKCMKPKSF